MKQQEHKRKKDFLSLTCAYVHACPCTSIAMVCFLLSCSHACPEGANWLDKEQGKIIIESHYFLLPNLDEHQSFNTHKHLWRWCIKSKWM